VSVIPIICQLSDPEKRQREATLLAQFKSGLIGAAELENGLEFRLPGQQEWLTLAAELMIAERECCPFLKFQLTAEPQMGELTLQITGPAGTKEFVKTNFGRGK